MKRVALRVLALAVTAVVLVFPAVAALAPTEADTGPDPVRITDYDATFDVRDDGSVRATETLTTEFPLGRHGIFRFWDLRDPSDEHVRLTPRDVDVTLDGADETFELQWQDSRRFRVAKIGSADRFVSPGSHVYAISYTIDGALSPSSAGRGDVASSSWADEQSSDSVFYWNVVAPGWGMAIDRSTVRVNLPVESGKVQCTSGFGGAAGSGTCDVTGGGTRQVTVETGALPPRTPVTVRVGLPVATPDRETLPWSIALDGVLGRNVPAAVTVLLVSLAALAVGYLLDRLSREREPGFGVAYEPPPGLGPVQSSYLMTERIPKRALVSTLLYQADRGLTTLKQNEAGGWTVTGVGDDAAWAATDDVTRHVGTKLGVTKAGSTFTASKKSVKAGGKLQETQSTLDDATHAWADGIGAQRKVAAEQLGRVGVVVAAVLAVVAFFVASASMYLLPFAAFTIGGIGLLLAGVGRRRTPLGRELWSHAGGFHRLLSTDSAQTRFDFSGRGDLYTAFIPFAVAFDCADRWARKYQMATGSVAPVPLWYGGTGAPSGTATAFGGGDTFDSFESSLSSSISAYAATQSTSSSGGGGGGGFSGGGGGGGGGGGSW